LPHRHIDAVESLGLTFASMPAQDGNLLNHCEHTHALGVTHCTFFGVLLRREASKHFLRRGGENGDSRPELGFSAGYGNRRQVSSIRYACTTLVRNSLPVTDNGL
jgi:hypothetical protein